MHPKRTDEFVSFACMGRSGLCARSTAPSQLCSWLFPCIVWMGVPQGRTCGSLLAGLAPACLRLWLGFKIRGLFVDLVHQSETSSCKFYLCCFNWAHIHISLTCNRFSQRIFLLSQSLFLPLPSNPLNIFVYTFKLFRSLCNYDCLCRLK